MRAERRRYGRGWRKLRRHGLAGLQGRTVAQYQRDGQRIIERYGAFPQRFILGAQQLPSEFEERWLRGEYPGVSVAWSSATALVRAIEASMFTARVALERLGLAYLSPRPGARRQLLEHGRAPRKGGR